MAARASVAIRLGTEGKASVKADFREIANDGDATANRWARSFERAGQDVEAAMKRQQLAAEKLAQITPATPMQRQVQAAASTSYTGGTAQESARFFAEQAAAAAQLEARTRALVASIDPAAVAQQRFNREMAEARALISAGAISLDQYVAKLALERTALDAATNAARRHGVSQGQMRAGSQQLSYSIGDFATQVSMGQGVLMAFSAQMNQTVNALALMQKESKGFIGFMGGPWGAVIQGGILLLGMLAGKYLDGSEAAKAKEKSARELESAIASLESRTRSAIETEYEAQRATLASAAAYRQQALDARAATIEKLRAAQAEVQRQRAVAPSMMSTNGMNANPALAAAASNASRLSAELDAAIADLERKDVIFKNAQAAFVGAEVQANLDRSARLTRDYQKVLAGLHDEFRRTGDIERYAQARAGLERQYKIEQEAISASEKKVRGKSDADRAAAKAQREAAKEARDYLRDLQSLQDRYDPLTAATRKYREELEKIAALRGAEAGKAGMYRDGAFEAYAKERAAILGDTLGMEGIRAEGQGEEERSQRIAQRKTDLADSIAYAERELQLVAANDNVRERELATLRFIQDLKRDLPKLSEEETAALVEQHERLMDIADATAKARADWEEWKGFASGVLDQIFDPNNWEDWGELGERVLKDLAKEFIMLAALNPLKNMMFGSSLPTLGGVFGASGLGGLFGGGGSNGIVAGEHDAFWGPLLPGGGRPGFATGTYHARGGLALVGENGPELVNLPRGSQVKGTSATRQALGGMGGMSVHIDASIHAPGADPAALARVEEQQRQMMAEFPRIALEAVADAQQRMRRPLGLAA